MDATKRLSLHAECIAYLEKHRIYELFHEIATQLVIQRPDDHFAFIKQCLHHAALKRDVPRIILIAPPHFDKMSLAKILQEELGVRPVTLKELRSTSPMDDDACRCDESESIALSMKRLLESGVMHESGWILLDIPRTKREARALQRFGIIPTHVLQIVTSCESDETLGNFDSGADFMMDPCKPKKPSENLEEHEYMNNLRGLREAYPNFLIEVEVGIRTVKELGKNCVKLARTKKHYGAPSLFRIALIGSRGSGCSTLAKHISERFNLVHVDYDYIAEQARLQDTALGDTLRLFEYRWGERPKPEIRIQIVQKYVSGYECLKRGWVLTGYPKSVEDFKLLDMIATPPNRVIFVEVHGDVCRERLLSRRYNVTTGSKHNISSKKAPNTDDCDLSIHPRDYRMVVERDLQEYEENVADMMKYAGESAVKIDGNGEEKVAREKLEACLIQPAPFSKPRAPKPPPRNDLEGVEFEPEDKPILNVTPTPEPNYSFI